MMFHRRLLMLLGVGLWMISVAAAPVSAQAQLFPQPFLVEHQLVQSDAQSESMVIGPVKDYYGASWVVSLQPDGARTIIDFSRDRMSVVDVAQAQYATISFDRLAELTRRFRLAEYGKQRKMGDLADGSPIEIEVAQTSARSKSVRLSESSSILRKPSVQGYHVQAIKEGKELGALDFWVDSSIHLSPIALDALERLESSMLGHTTQDQEPGFQTLLAEGRRRSGGALVVATSHSLVFGRTAEQAGTMDDVVLRLKALSVFPTDLLEIPANYVRVAHPLETIVNYAEQEATLRRRMSDVDGQ